MWFVGQFDWAYFQIKTDKAATPRPSIVKSRAGVKFISEIIRQEEVNQELQIFRFRPQLLWAILPRSSEETELSVLERSFRYIHSLYLKYRMGSYKNYCNK